MIKDIFGQVILEEDDLMDRLMTDPKNPITQGFTKNINLEPIKELIDELPNFTDYKLLDTDIGFEEKLYGYHRLNDPKVSYQYGAVMKVWNLSEMQLEPEPKPVGIINRKDLNLTEPTEPNKY